MYASELTTFAPVDADRSQQGVNGVGCPFMKSR
jgi:hypothetical protein